MCLHNTKSNSTNFKTSLQSITSAVTAMQGIKVGAYIGSNGLFDTATVNAYRASIKGLSATQAEAALSASGLTAAQRQQILTSKESTVANAGQATSFNVLTKAVWANVKAMAKWLVTTPTGWITLAIGATAGLIAAYNNVEKKQNELIENARNLQEEYRSFAKDTAGKITSLEGQAEEFNKLAKGVDKYGNNISLASDEYDRYKSIVAEILGYSPELIQGYDAEGNAIADKNGLLERSIELLKEEQRLKLKEMTTDEKTGEAYDAAEAGWQQVQGYEGANIRNEIARWFDNNALRGGVNYEVDIAKVLGIKDEWKEEGNNLQNAIINNIDTVVKNIKDKKAELLAISDSDGNAIFSVDEIDNMIDLSNDWQYAYNQWQQDIEDAKHGMDDQFDLYAQRAKSYNDLTDAQKVFVNEYIRATGDITDAEGHLLSEDKILEKAKGYEKFVNEFAELNKLGEGGSVDLTFRPEIDAEELNKKGWEAGEGFATVFSSAISNTDFEDLMPTSTEDTVAINFTPIIVDPNTGEFKGVLSEEELYAYAHDVLAGVREDDLNLQIGAKFEGKNAIDEAVADGERIHYLHEKLFINNDTVDSWEELRKVLVKTGDDAVQAGENHDKMTDSLEGVTKTLSTLQGKYDELKSAQDEYNSTGAISAETMQKLIDNDLLQYLDYSSGKLKINTDALLAEGEAAKVNAIQKLQDAMATDLMNLATGKTDDLSNTAKTAIANLGKAAETTGGQAETAAGKLAGFAIAAQAAKDGAEGNLKDMSVEDFNLQADAIIAAYTSAAKSIGGITIKSPKSSSSKSDKNKPDYEDPTEAIVNRINLRANELEQQEEYIQNALEIAEIENDYEKQISLTNDLIATRKKRVEELNIANAGLHNEAEWLRNSNPWDEKSWFDSQGNATESYYKAFNSASTKEEQEKIKDLFESLSKYKKSYMENAEEITGLNKEILQGEKEIVDLQNEYLEDTVSQIERHIDKIKEAKQDEIDMEEALLSIREKSYETLNKLAEAQHEADKAIRTSRIAYQYLDEDMISQIYNEEDYKRISDKITEVQDELSEDTARFLSEVEEAYAQDKLYLVESITAEYERQCALKERELEIFQAEIDLQKKQEQLNNVLAEKNVRLLKNGQWVWTHDADNARQAAEELADAEYEYERLQKERKQQLTLDTQQHYIDGLTSEVSMLDSQVEKLNKVVENITDPLNDFFTLIDSIVSYGNKALSNATDDIIKGATKAGGSGYSPSGYYNGSIDYTNAIANAKSEAEVIRLNNERNNKIDQNGLSYHKMGNDEAVDYWKSKRGYASGTKRALPGLADINEGNLLEGLITKDGTLIPMANLAGGEMVFNHEMMENLWHHAQTPWNIHTPNIPSFATKMPSVIEKGQSFYGDINVYNPTDWNDFMRQLNIQTKSHNAITNKM